MATLPTQVQAALDAADQIESGIVDPAPALDTQPPAPEPAPAPAPEPEPPATPPAPQPDADEDTWKSKYLTLQGMHRADVNRLTSDKNALQTKVDELTTALAAAKASAPPPEPKPAAKLVTDKDSETFGEDLVDLMKRVAGEAAAPLEAKVADLEAENARLKGTVDTVAQARTTGDQRVFVADLTTLVPDWETVNVDQGWLQWLSADDPLSGTQRQVLLDAAVAARDAKRTSALFNAFKATLTPPAPAPEPSADTLSKQVTPGSTRGQVLTPQPAPTTWTPQAIEKFYNALARGEYKGREKEASNIEAEIDRSLSGTA